MGESKQPQGCFSFSKNQWIVILVIGVIVGILTWVDNATTTTHPATINLTITRATMIQGFNAFEGCDFTGHPFRVGVVRDGSASASVRESPGRGYVTSDNDCQYTIFTNVEASGRYGIRFDNAEMQFTDWFDADGVEEEDEDGDTRLVFTVEW